MDVIEVLRTALDRSIGTAGAIQNCRREREQQASAEAQLALVCARIPAADRAVGTERATA